MKKIWFLALLPLVFLAAGCSFVKKSEAPLNDEIPATNTDIDTNISTNTQNNTCTVPDIASTTDTGIDMKTVLPPVSTEEKNKTFTYKDEETGVKLNYPGSCYFNKGVFQCSDFTLSIWTLDTPEKTDSTAVKTFNEDETQIKYTFSHNKKSYALMAWYDGKDDLKLDKVIDKIFKSISFTK